MQTATRLKRVLLSFAAAISLVSAAQSQSTPGVVKRVAWSRPITLVSFTPNRTTPMNFQGTDLRATARGTAQVRMERGNAQIDARFQELLPPTTLGPEYTCYVLWAVTSEGNTFNLGEVALDGESGRIRASVPLQAFAMFVTAEPYFAIASPSNVVVLENVKADRTTGTISTVTPRFELVEKGEYFAAGLEPFIWDSRQPRDLFQARNAVRIAEWQGAAQYAPSALADAKQVLQQAELEDQRRGNNRSRVIQSSRQAAQLAEGARVTAERGMLAERLERERIEAAERAAAAEASRIAAAEEAERQTRARAEAEAARQQAEIARHEAEAARLAAEDARSNAAGEAEVARLAADQARQMLEQAQAEMQRLEAERQELRQRLLDQFNMILETRDTARGLILNMGDVLFDIGKSELRFEAREKLARLSGLLLAHPELTLEIEGHTDSTGSDELNQTLSEQRAEGVRSYLVSQGVAAESVTARGLGKTAPIASNDTAGGRQQNRRVEIIVSGEALGQSVEQLQ
jgi:outer membrane protein OmpA-like peptidoglycan-associated protein